MIGVGDGIGVVEADGDCIVVEVCVVWVGTSVGVDVIVAAVVWLGVAGGAQPARKYMPNRVSKYSK